MTKTKTYILNIGVLLLFMIGPLSAQDLHLSQFRNAPIAFNPANTGCFSGDWRAAFNYRKQWSALGTPFENNGLSFDK